MVHAIEIDLLGEKWEENLGSTVLPTRADLVSYPDRFRRLHFITARKSVRVLRNGVKWPADGWGLVYETRADQVR